MFKDSVSILFSENKTSEMQKDKAKELGQLILEKVKFLSEGKETVPPVQVMAIQLEVCNSCFI